MILVAATLVLIALALVIWSTARIVKRVSREEGLLIGDIVLCAVPLVVIAGLVCLGLEIFAGLSHSACFQKQAQLACILSFVVIMGCPVAGLLLYKYHLSLVRRRHGPSEKGTDSTGSRSVRVVAAVAVLAFASIILYLLGSISLWPPLMLALRNNYTEMATFLVKRGLFSDESDVCGFKPLPYCALVDKSQLVKLLIESGAPVDTMDNHEMTALRWATINRNTDLAKFLLDRGADVNMAGNERTPLMLASEAGNVELVKLFVAGGAKVNARGAQGSALSRAARRNNVEVAKLLLDHGADPNVKNASDWTPLMQACYEGHEEVVGVLLDRGADPNVRGYQQDTALKLATRKGYTRIVELLKSHAADANPAE